MPFSLLVAAAAVVQAVPSSGCQQAHLNPATLVHLQVGPVPAAPAPEDHGVAQLGTMKAGPIVVAGGGGKVLGYTRISARYRPCGGGRDLQRERRDILRRLFAGKHAEKVVTLDLHVTPLDVKASKPLLTIKRDSSTKGEGWSTDVVNSAVLLPFFRVDRSSTVAVKASLKSARSYETRAAGGALDLVERASKLLNPTTAMITEANKERFNEAATFVDTTIDNLLHVTIQETASSRIPLTNDSGEQVLAVITVSLPMANNSFASAAHPAQILGEWEIYAEPYRPSMMVDGESSATLAKAEAVPATVLNYLVDEKKTLREALAGSKSVSAMRDALAAAKVVKGDAKAVEDAARTLCRTVTAEAEALGLAPVDAGAAAWAYVRDMALDGTKQGAADRGCAGVQHYAGWPNS